MATAKTYFGLFQQTFKEWNDDNVPRLAASIGFFTALSLAPLLVVLLTILSFFFGDEAARGQIVAQFSGEFGSETAEFIQQTIENASRSDGGIISTIISIGVLIFGATGVFVQLQSALNEVWDITVEGGIQEMIKKRILSFGMLITLAFLLLVSLVINATIAYLDTFLSGFIPLYQWLAHLLTTAVSFGISTLLFALIYKYMPDAKIAWRDVAIGALITALLFTFGRFLLSLYFGNFSVASSYGAAGSFFVILIWVFYSTQIVMFGAEFTQVYTRHRGSQIVPQEGASFTLDKRIKLQDVSIQEIEEHFSENSINEEQIEAGVVDDDAVTAHTPDEIEAQMRESRTGMPATITEIDAPQTEVVEDDYTYPEDEKRKFAMIVGSFTAVVGATLGWIVAHIRRDRAESRK